MQVRGLTQYDRVAFACRFLDDEELTSYLDHLEESALKSGALQGLLLSGLTERSLPLLQAFVDRTADVQTGALLSALVSPRRFKSEIADQWMTTYRCAAPPTPYRSRASMVTRRALVCWSGQGAAGPLAAVPPALPARHLHHAVLQRQNPRADLQRLPVLRREPHPQLRP